MYLDVKVLKTTIGVLTVLVNPVLRISYFLAMLLKNE